MRFSTLSEWLTWISTIHSKSIDLNLERVRTVAERLHVLRFSCPVITVGGTNGKGSTVAAINAILRTANLNIGTFTTPFLFQHNEQVQINDKEAKDEEFCEAYSKIEKARENIPLTSFEFNTLAALMLFKKHKLDAVILEVGLGGRLDAVNIIDADIAVTTSIGIDHTELLGNTRDAIGFEKAGIYRPNHPAICGDPNPPSSLLNYANEIGAIFYCQGKDFTYHALKSTWRWIYKNFVIDDLPKNRLLLQNMSTALMVIHLLQSKLPITIEQIKIGLRNTQLIGRLQEIHAKVIHIIDVSHNPDSVEQLAKKLKQDEFQGQTYAVFSMLADKNINQCLALISNQISEWFVAPLKTPRSCTKYDLMKLFEMRNINNATFFDSIETAYKNALDKVRPSDRIVVFGSFHTVSECYPLIKLPS